MNARRGLTGSGGMQRHLRVLVAACGLATGWSAAADAEPPPVPRRTVVDPGVMQAGGVCRGCRDPLCRACGSRHHHAACRDGKCHAHCPVRPQEFGFYGTQWRRWPTQGVVPTAGIQEATPTLPPRSAVPGADEESRGPGPGELPAPEPGAVEPPAVTAPELQPAQPTVPPADEPATAMPDEPVAPAPEPPPKELETTPAPAVKEPAGDDLFDESATGPVRRRFIARPAIAAAPTAVRPATLTYPVSAEQQVPPAPAGRQARVPRVPFDAAAEAARLRR